MTREELINRLFKEIPGGLINVGMIADFIIEYRKEIVAPLVDFYCPEDSTYFTKIDLIEKAVLKTLRNAGIEEGK